MARRLAANRILHGPVALMGLMALALSGASTAQDHGSAVAEMVPADNDIADVASLQRGAKYFVNYCLGCHSAQYVRYNRLGEDLGLSDAQVLENLMFGTGQLHDTMVSSMRPEDGLAWFGIAPPDLSLIARSRGVDYLYNYLRGFYADPSRPTGSNNLWLENTAMPDVLWELGGTRSAVFSEHDDDGTVTRALDHFEVIREGALSEGEYDGMVRDITNFLEYIGEPVQLERRALGVRVIAFLLIFLVIAYMLKREIWRDLEPKGRRD